MTDTRARRAAPRLNLSGREWKLYLLGGLGLAYAASLSAIATQTQPGVAQALATPSTPQASANNAVWLDQLPPAARPNVTLQPNWTLANSSSSSPIGVNSGSAPVVAGAAMPRAASGSSSGQVQPTSRAPRILTRTS